MPSSTVNHAFITIQNTSPEKTAGCRDFSGNKHQDMLGRYMGLSRLERRKFFASTIMAADIVGLSQRTIQLWVEIGAISAVRIGRNYRVYLPSLEEHLALNNSDS